MNYENLNDARKIQEYVTNMRPTFNKRAVFSDETENYRTPAEPEAGDTVNVRIRTKKNNVDFIFLVYDDVRQPMEWVESKDGFDYYGTDVQLGSETIRYYFEIISGKIHCYYNYCKNPPIHYIVFATPHKKKYLLQNSQSADWLFYYVKITKNKRKI